MEHILLEIALTFITKDNSLVEIGLSGVICQTQKSYVLTIKIAINFIL